MQMVWPASDNEYFKTTKLMADNEYFKTTKVDDYLAHSLFPYISLLIKQLYCHDFVPDEVIKPHWIFNWFVSEIPLLAMENYQ